jgi:hypothetical protein
VLIVSSAPVALLIAQNLLYSRSWHFERVIRQAEQEMGLRGSPECARVRRLVRNLSQPQSVYFSHGVSDPMGIHVLASASPVRGHILENLRSLNPDIDQACLGNAAVLAHVLFESSLERQRGGEVLRGFTLAWAVNLAGKGEWVEAVRWLRAGAGGAWGVESVFRGVHLSAVVHAMLMLNPPPDVLRAIAGILGGPQVTDPNSDASVAELAWAGSVIERAESARLSDGRIDIPWAHAEGRFSACLPGMGIALAQRDAGGPGQTEWLEGVRRDVFAEFAGGQGLLMRWPLTRQRALKARLCAIAETSPAVREDIRAAGTALDGLAPEDAVAYLYSGLFQCGFLRSLKTLSEPSIAAARAAVAARLFEAEKGRMPRSLDELVPDYLEAPTTATPPRSRGQELLDRIAPFPGHADVVVETAPLDRDLAMRLLGLTWMREDWSESTRWFKAASCEIQAVDDARCSVSLVLTMPSGVGGEERAVVLADSLLRVLHAEETTVTVWPERIVESQKDRLAPVMELKEGDPNGQRRLHATGNVNPVNLDEARNRLTSNNPCPVDWTYEGDFQVRLQTILPARVTVVKAKRSSRDQLPEWLQKMENAPLKMALLAASGTAMLVLP